MNEHFLKIISALQRDNKNFQEYANSLNRDLLKAEPERKRGPFIRNQYISAIKHTEKLQYPYSQTLHTTLLSQTNMVGIRIERIRNLLSSMKQTIDKLIMENKDRKSDLFTYRDVLNKNQLKFGLAGLSRNAVNKHIEENPSAIDGLGSFYTSYLEQEPHYHERLSGGVTTAKKRKKSKTKKIRKRK